MVPSYDPVLNLLIVGTSVTSPAPKFMLDGNDKQYLYHNSTLALNADTGKIVWYYQHVVDHWDLDHPFERLLVDTAVAPDPKTGELDQSEASSPARGARWSPASRARPASSTRSTGRPASSSGRGPPCRRTSCRRSTATGKVTVNPETLFTGPNQERSVCPSINGGKNWPAGAYSPQTRHDVLPAAEHLHGRHDDRREHGAIEAVYGFSTQVSRSRRARPTSEWSRPSPSRPARTAWKHEQRAGTLSLVATGGGLVFGGDANGRFRAFDEQSGKVLWEVNLGSPVSGYPVTFAVDGKQYVAVSTGPSLVANAAIRLTPELKPSSASQLYVFALP